MWHTSDIHVSYMWHTCVMHVSYMWHTCVMHVSYMCHACVIQVGGKRWMICLKRTKLRSLTKGNLLIEINAIAHNWNIFPNFSNSCEQERYFRNNHLLRWLIKNFCFLKGRVTFLRMFEYYLQSLYSFRKIFNLH